MQGVIPSSNVSTTNNPHSHMLISCGGRENSTWRRSTTRESSVVTSRDQSRKFFSQAYHPLSWSPKSKFYVCEIDVVKYNSSTYLEQEQVITCIWLFPSTNMQFIPQKIVDNENLIWLVQNCNNTIVYNNNYSFVTTTSKRD